MLISTISFKEIYYNINLWKFYYNRCSRFWENDVKLLYVFYVLMFYSWRRQYFVAP